GLKRNLHRRAELDAGRGEVFKRQGNWKDAISSLSSAVAIYEDVRKRDPKDETLLNEQPALYATLADCYEAAGEASAAIRAARTALQRYQEIEAARALVLDEQTERSRILAKLAHGSR